MQGWFRGERLHAEWGRETGGPAPGLAEAGGGGPPAHSWPPRVPGVRAETRIADGDGRAPVRVRWYLPAALGGARPAWLLLHGVAVQGPDHPGLARFAAALASAGAVAAIPEVPAWSRLEVDPAPADPIVARTLRHLCSAPEAQPGGVVLAGFSFGAPQALRLAAELADSGSIRAAVGFGGYCDLAAAFRFGLAGTYEHKGRVRQARPDPYGRWVAAANYLHRTPGFEGAGRVSRALRTLAATAGAYGVLAWEPFYDQLKDELADALPPADRELFRRFAPPAGQEPDAAWAEEVALRMARAALAVHPRLVLPDELSGARLPRIRLVHGRHDPLVPFTESLALKRRLRALGAARTEVTITRLFGHARESGSLAAQPVEALRFFRMLRALMKMQRRPRET